MHGVARLRTTEEEKLRKKKERDTELAVYKTEVAKIFEMRSNKEYNSTMLKLTSDLLSRNPDFYTLWNIRREVLLHFLDCEEQSNNFKDMFDTDLKLTETCLKVNPKSYCAWHHRLWILKTRNDPNWEMELKLCTAFLKLDGRNFHCWNYRDHVVENFKVDLLDEFEYSLKKIEENFSNYSAWHYRSKLLMKLFTQPENPTLLQDDKHRDDLELVINAAFTDPNDTSAWFYQRWLLGAPKREVQLAMCHVKHKKSCISFTQSVKINNANCLIHIGDKLLSGIWKPVIHPEYDVIWVFEHERLDYDDATDITVTYIRSNGSKCIVKCEYTALPKFDDYFVGCGKVSFTNNFGPSVIQVLEEQLEMCQQLLEMEPDSKWTLLTYAVLKHSIDHIANYESCREILVQLQKLDSLRANYYKDLMSRWHIEYLLEIDMPSVMQGKFITRDQDKSDVELTNIYHGQYWSSCYMVDLSNFKMFKCMLSKIAMFQNCEVLETGDVERDIIDKYLVGIPNLKNLYISGQCFSYEH